MRTNFGNSWGNIGCHVGTRIGPRRAKRRPRSPSRSPRCEKTYFHFARDCLHFSFLRPPWTSLTPIYWSKDHIMFFLYCLIILDCRPGCRVQFLEFCRTQSGPRGEKAHGGAPPALWDTLWKNSGWIPSAAIRNIMGNIKATCSETLMIP